MKKHRLLTADFAKTADALANESFHGIIHLDICKGLGEMDPFIGNYAPVFFTYTFYGHLYAAQMYAIKLFDTHGAAFTIPKYLEMARLRKDRFRHASEAEVLEGIAEAEVVIKRLTPAVNVLRRRRNDFLAHISESLVFKPEELQRAKTLTIGQIRDVLLEGARVVNNLLLVWNKCANQLLDRDSDDYKKVVSIVNKQLCAEAKAHDEEFGKYGLTIPSQARPRDCLTSDAGEAEERGAGWIRAVIHRPERILVAGNRGAKCFVFFSTRVLLEGGLRAWNPLFLMGSS